MRSLFRVTGLPAWQDPETPANQLEAMVQEEPRVLMNPSMPAEVLLTNAKLWPEYVELNPVLVLLFMENDTVAIYHEIQENLARGWVSHAFSRLPENTRRKLAISFAERVLPLLAYHDAMAADFQRYIDDARYALSLAKSVAAGVWYNAGQMSQASWRCHDNAEATDSLGDRMRSSVFYACSSASSTNQNSPAMGSKIAETANHARDAVFEAAYDPAMEAAIKAGDNSIKRYETAQAAAWAKSYPELLWEAAQVRQARADLLADEARRSKRHSKLPGKSSDEKETKIKEAIKQAQEGSAKIKAVLAEEPEEGHPVWLGLGLIAGGTVAAILIGPELIAAFAAEEAGVAVATAAEEILAASEAGEVGTVSVQAFIDGLVEIGGNPAAEDALAQLVEKLSNAGVEVVDAMAEIVIRMPK